MKEPAKPASVTSIAPWMKERINGASAVKYIVMHLGGRTAEDNTNCKDKGKEDQN